MTVEFSPAIPVEKIGVLSEEVDSAASKGRVPESAPSPPSPNLASNGVDPTATFLATQGNKKKLSLNDLVRNISGLDIRFLNVPHYNSRYHTEGGLNAVLADHLKEIVAEYNAIINGDNRGVPDLALKLIRKIDSEKPELLEGFTIFHDIGKESTTIKDEVTGDYSYVGHEKVSYDMLSSGEVKYKGEAVSGLLKLIIKHHIFAFHVKHAGHLGERYDFRKDYDSLVKSGEITEDYKIALELLIATTALDLSGSKGPEANLQPVEDLIVAYENFLKIEALKSEIKFDELDKSKQNSIRSKGLGQLETKVGLVSDEEISKIKTVIEPIINPPKSLLSDEQFNQLDQLLTAKGYEKKLILPLKTVKSIDEAEKRLKGILRDNEEKIKDILETIKSVL